MLPQNQLVNTHYPNVLPTVTCCPANANRCIPSLKKTQVSSDPVLLISPVPHLYNITFTLVMLKPSSNEHTVASHPHRQEIEKQVEILGNGIIEPSVRPWASPVVLVKKADNTIRLCIDYRNLNKATTKDSYHLPHIQNTLDTLYGNNLFTTLDLLKGYHQTEVKESSCEKTAFTTHIGLFQYILLPFGLTNAPASFQRLLEHVH